MSSKTMKASVIIGGSISGAFKSALSTTKNGLKQIGEEIANVERRQRLMGRGIETFARQGKSVDYLRSQYSGLTREADRLRAAQSRLADVQGRIEVNTARRQQLGGQLRGAAMTFGVVAAATLAPVRSAIAFENAMLGVAKQVEGARDAGGRLTPVYFGMAKQIQRLGREIPLATTELADMVAAGARMGVAKGELIDFTRTAAMMADAFEMPAGALAEDMGKIAGLFQVPIPRIGELADAINYLDDNAKSSGRDIIDVLRRVGGMAQALKMPGKEAAALGSTFLTLGSSAEVAGTATNAVLRILGAATAQSKRVRNGMASIGMNPEDVQRSMAKDATGTILSVLDKLNALNNEQRMVAATQLFGAEYGDDIAKLATGANEYRRQLALVNAEQSKGSMSREFQARLQTTSAQWQITKNRLNEVAVVVGGALVPAIDRLLATAAPMIEGFADWSRENPGLIKGVVGSALALSGLRVATLGVGYAWAAIKTPILSVMGFIARFRATGALASLGKFGPAAVRILGVVRTVGAAIAAIGGGPIAVVVGALTAGALIVRKYWQPIAAWVTGYFGAIRTAIAPAMAEIGAALAPLKPAWDAFTSAVGRAFDWFMKLLQPVNMTSEELKAAGESGASFGRIVGAALSFVLRQVVTVVKAIGWIGVRAIAVGTIVVDNMVSAWTKIKSFVGSAIDWIVQKMQPMISAALAVGNMVANASGALGFGPTAAPAAPGGASAGAPRPTRGRRAPAIPAPAARGGSKVAAAPAQHTYHITQQPGESGESLARRVAAEHKRQEGVDRRGSLVDAAA